MYSTRCQHCKQLLNFKTEEIRVMVNEAQEARQKHYEIRCPQCGKYMKLQVSELKRRLPAPEPAESAEAPATPAPAEHTEAPAPPAEAAPKKKRSKQAESVKQVETSTASSEPKPRKKRSKSVE